MASVLNIIQDACRDVHILPIPNSLVNNNTPDIALMYRKLTTLGKMLVKDYAFQELIKEATFTSVGTTDQGNILDIAGSDFSHIIPDTITNERPTKVTYVSSEKEWTEFRILRPSLPVFRLRGNRLLLLPNNYAGDTWYFEYISKNWVLSENGNSKDTITVDTDTTVFNEELMTLGTVSMFKQDKGLDNTADAAKFEKLLNDLIFNNEPKQPISMGCKYNDDVNPFVPPSGDAWSIA